MSRSIASWPDAAGRLALGVEAVGQVGDRLLEALRDGREVLLVAGDQRRVGLGGEVVGKVERAGRQGIHVISSAIARSPVDVPARPTSTTPLRDSHWHKVLASAGDSAARPGSCRKTPVRYRLKVEGLRRARWIS